MMSGGDKQRTAVMLGIINPDTETHAQRCDRSKLIALPRTNESECREERQSHQGGTLCNPSFLLVFHHVSAIASCGP